VEYLQFWLQHDSTAIGLIHLNDSKYERGARKDRHAPPGHGHIGLETLGHVIAMANQYCIPMVVE
jgi:deoxyribonuclease-4